MILIFIVYLKNYWFFEFNLTDVGLDERGVGGRAVTFVLFHFLEIGSKHAPKSRKPTMTS